MVGLSVGSASEEHNSERSKESFYKYKVDVELYYKLDLMDELINFKAKRKKQMKGVISINSSLAMVLCNLFPIIMPPQCAIFMWLNTSPSDHWWIYSYANLLSRILVLFMIHTLHSIGVDFVIHIASK